MIQFQTNYGLKCCCNESVLLFTDFFCPLLTAEFKVQISSLFCVYKLLYDTLSNKL